MLRRPAACALAAGLALGAAGVPPRRIVALAPSAAEILFALGAADRVVGVPDFTDDLPEAAGKPRTGGFAPDLERVVALAPDLVVVSRDGTDRAAYEKLKSLGLEVSVTSARSLAGVLADIRAVASAIGAPEAGERLAASLAARIAAAERRGGARPGPRPRAVAVIWPDPPVVAGPDSFLGDLLLRAGLANVVPPGAGEWPRVTFETLSAWSPDLVVRPATRENEAAFARAFGADGRWGILRAVRAGRVVTLPGGWLERPGPRLVDALERLAALGPGGAEAP